jgi:hypothetical protein
MPGKQGNLTADAHKMASLSIVWGAVAGVAYLGLIEQAVTLIKKSTGWNGPDAGDTGLRTFAAPAIGPSLTPIGTILVEALPFAVVAVLALGIAARVRPALTWLSGVQIAAGVVGLVGAALIFVGAVANNAGQRTGFLVALGTIVAVSILLRLQRVIRRFHRRYPAVASLLVGALVIAYIFLTNGTSLSGIVLSKLDVWLALVAFSVVVFAAVQLTRIAQHL